MYSFITSACRNLKAILYERLHRPSLVEEWRQCRQRDTTYLQHQIERLRNDTLEVEGFLEENPFRLEALDSFSTSDVNYRDPTTLDELLKGHHVAHTYIFQNRERLENSAPELLQEYFFARGEFEEQIQRIDLETPS